jgi:hypothetical protein
MTTDLDRLRTDAIISIHKASPFDFKHYAGQIPEGEETPLDTATMLGGMSPELPEFRMTNLSAPMAVSQMKIPSHADFIAGHTKVSNSPLTDWPIASPENQFGEHQPFGMKSNSCPLLHGAAWGDPAYAEHLAHAMPNLKEIAQREKRINFDPDRYGQPKETLHDLMIRDRNRYNTYSDEEYRDGKVNEWQKRLGLLPYLFGLEYNSEDQREHFIRLMKKMGTKKDLNSPDSRVLRNKMQEKAGISWGRALRSFRARFIPLLQWWRRASDRHGPVTPAQMPMPMMMPNVDLMKSDPSNADLHFVSPYVEMPQGVEESFTHHWWDIFQPWGGVGRDYNSLHDILKQSYPEVFDNGWLDDVLMNTSNNMLDTYDSDGGSHFPNVTNHPDAKGHPDHASLKSNFNDAEFFEKRRANWSHASNLHFLHPSEVQGQGGRMLIPSDQMMMSRLGRSLSGQADMGSPRIGMFREEHPSSNPTYWDNHNALFAANDMHMGKVMNNMAQKVMKQLGSGILNPADPKNMEQATLARGNLQQLASAADFAMKKVNMGDEYRALAPSMNGTDMAMQLKSIGPVHPSSFATTPPIYNTGNTHLWGHEMPATLTWKHDPQSGGISFGMAEEPFNIMQRTVHENKIKAVLPSLLESSIMPKQRDIHALSALDSRGLSPIATGSILKAEDYEPTGVFTTKIIPAYTIHKLEDMDKLKGFSGDWIVQKMPQGKRMFVEKKGNHLKTDKLPSKIKKQLREIKGDFIFDGYLDGKTLKVVDLLVHKGSDLHLEPLDDRINALRTLYDSTENVHFPMPTNCVSTDHEGLDKAISNFDENELLIRDSKSTFMKEKEVHPKWIRYAKESIAKAFYPPMPELIVYPNQIKLVYPSIYDPVIVKGDFDGKGFNISSFEGYDAIFDKARKDIPLWGPVAIDLLKEGAAAGGGGGASSAGGASGAFTSSDAGSYQPLHSTPKRKKPRKLKITKQTLLRAPSIIGENEEGDNVAAIMQFTRKAITKDDTAKTTEYLLKNVKGLNKKMLEMYCGEYGIEKTEDSKKWTVNQAIDDDVIENMFPRMNRVSPDGGAWSGLQADITAPRGPTELIEDSGTTFYDPKESEEVEEIPMKHLQVKDNATGDQAVVDIENGKATLRMPLKTQQGMADEQESEPDDRSEAEEI